MAMWKMYVLFFLWCSRVAARQDLSCRADDATCTAKLALNEDVEIASGAAIELLQKGALEVQVVDTMTKPHVALEPSASKLSLISVERKQALKSAVVQDFQGQMRTFTMVATVMILGAAVLLSYSTKGSSECPTSVLVVVACLFFGVDNFLMAYAGEYLGIPSSHAGFKFMLDGVAAFTLHVGWRLLDPGYESQWKAVQGASWLAVSFVAFTGVLIGLAQLCGNIGFNIDPKESGPHQALCTGSVLIVAPFFFWYCNECLTKVQLFGCGMIVAGVIVMSDLTHWADGAVSWAAFTWVFVSMVFYGLSNITWRLAAIQNSDVPWQPQVLIIFGFMGLVGCCHFVHFCRMGAYMDYVHTPLLLLWPCLNVIASFLGMWCVNLALNKPDVAMGAMTAVVDSNSVVLLVLNRAILGLVPSASKMSGMALILAGCVTICSNDLTPQTSKIQEKVTIRTEQANAKAAEDNATSETEQPIKNAQ